MSVLVFFERGQESGFLFSIFFPCPIIRFHLLLKLSALELFHDHYSSGDGNYGGDDERMHAIRCGKPGDDEAQLEYIIYSFIFDEDGFMGHGVVHADKSVSAQSQG